MKYSVKIFETWSEKQLRMANICLFQMAFSQWRPAQIIFAFPKNFFCKGSQHYAHKISRSTDQPFKLFAIFLVISWTNIGRTVFLYFLLFIIFDFLKIPLLTHSALISALIRHVTRCCPLLYQVLRSLLSWNFVGIIFALFRRIWLTPPPCFRTTLSIVFTE